jgi:hypothetical protein
MIVNRLQNGLINSRIGPRDSRLNCQKYFFFKWDYILLFSNSENNNYYVSMRNLKRFGNGIGIEYESVHMSSFNT